MTDTEVGLVSGRGCGDCSACCVTLRIEESALKKYADVPCPNLRPEGAAAFTEAARTFAGIRTVVGD
jgi:hypothetical protein